MAVSTRLAPSWCHSSGLLLSTRPGSVSFGALTTRTVGTRASCASAAVPRAKATRAVTSRNAALRDRTARAYLAAGLACCDAAPA